MEWDANIKVKRGLRGIGLLRHYEIQQDVDLDMIGFLQRTFNICNELTLVEK